VSNEELADKVGQLIKYAVDSSVKHDILDNASIGRKFKKVARGIADLVYAREAILRPLESPFTSSKPAPPVTPTE
jgi:hypothetical protein